MIDIDCVDGTSRNDPAMDDDRRDMPGALRVHSIGQLVRSVIQRAGTSKIRRLRIFGHGGDGYQGLGQSANTPTEASHYLGISWDSVSMYREQFNSLRDHFAHWEEIRNGQRVSRSGWVELHGCNVAAGPTGQTLIQALADIWQVRVAASPKTQFTVPGFEGPYFVARPYEERLELRPGWSVAQPSPDEAMRDRYSP